MNFISRVFCEFLILMIIRQHSQKIAESIKIAETIRKKDGNETENNK